jgi:hypothetical protein
MPLGTVDLTSDASEAAVLAFSTILRWSMSSAANFKEGPSQNQRFPYCTVYGLSDMAIHPFDEVTGWVRIQSTTLGARTSVISILVYEKKQCLGAVLGVFCIY